MEESIQTLSPEVFDDLKFQAQILTKELRGKLRAWRQLGDTIDPTTWPVVMVLEVEADQAVYVPLNHRESPKPYCIMKVHFIFGEKIRFCKYEGLSERKLVDIVRYNFVELEKKNGKVCPKG